MRFATDGNFLATPCWVVAATRRFHDALQDLRVVEVLEGDEAPAARRSLAKVRAEDARRQLVGVLVEAYGSEYGADVTVKVDGRVYTARQAVDDEPADGNGYRLEIMGRGGLPHPDSDPDDGPDFQ